MEPDLPAAPPKSRGSALFLFFLSLIGLGAFKVLLGFWSLPQTWIAPVSVLATIVFVTVPVFALYRAAGFPWSTRGGFAALVLGVLMHAGFQIISLNVFGAQGMAGAVTGAIRDIGLFTWCVGLGAVLATKLSDKNLLIPVSVFLAGFDIFLVLTPIGPVKQILQKAPEVVTSVALTVPQASTAPTGGVAAPFAYVGPADFIFMAAFFIALYRFNMRLRATAIALIPAILIYLVASLLGPIPLLVPIGLTVLIVNAREFNLNKEEWASTAVVAALVVGLIAWGMTRRAPQAEPSPSEPSPAVEGSAGSPAPAR